MKRITQDKISKHEKVINQGGLRKSNKLQNKKHNATK